jgi:glucose/arabinose dehydrogenase
MQTQRWCRTLLSAIAVLSASCLILPLASAQNESNSGEGTKSQACPNDDSGLKLPAGFCATVFADGIGHARHVVVAPNGVVYTNTWSGEYYDNTAVHPGGFLVALQDKSGAGKADQVSAYIRGRFTPRSTIESCGTRCLQVASHRTVRPKPSSPNCR